MTRRQPPRDGHNGSDGGSANARQQDNRCDHHEGLRHGRNQGHECDRNHGLNKNEWGCTSLDFSQRLPTHVHQYDHRVDNVNDHRGGNPCDHRAQWIGVHTLAHEYDHALDE